MATKTLSELRDALLRLGDYENASRLTTPFLNECINNGIASLYDLVTDLFQGHFLRTQDFVTVAGTQEIELPNDFADLRSVQRQIAAEEFTPPLRRIVLLQTYRYSGRGTPIKYDLIGETSGTPSGPGRLRLWPIPDGVYTMRLTYDALWTPLSSDSDSFYFANNWEQFVLYEALLQIDVREERPLSEHEALSAKYRARIVGAAAKRNSAEPEYLVSHASHDDDGMDL